LTAARPGLSLGLGGPLIRKLVVLLFAALGASSAWATGETLSLNGPCEAAALPLDVHLSPEWTAEQRQRTSAFLCGMLPVLRDLYGDPFERLAVVLVRDPAAAGVWTFAPGPMEVLSDGAWDPQLLTHELVHAFRGRRVLTRTSDGRLLPELFGFEEGFAEGVADLAMNEYVRRHCPGGDCSAALVPSRRLWTSGLEWTYDLANDASLRTGALWSDGGGTGKARERYQMAAAVLLRRTWLNHSNPQRTDHGARCCPRVRRPRGLENRRVERPLGVRILCPPS